MIQVTAKRVSSQYFVGLSVTKLVVAPQMISICFGPDKQIDMVTRWELIDTQLNALLDQSMDIKGRSSFLLYRIISKKLLIINKTSLQTEFVFEGDLKLIVI